MFKLSQNKSFDLNFFKKQRDYEDKGEAYARSKSAQKSFVQYFRSPSNDRTKHNDNRYRSRSTSRNNSYNKTYSQNRYRSTSRGRFGYDKSTTPPLNTLDHDMILINAIHGLTALRTDLLLDLLVDTTLALDIDHAPIQETIILQDIQIHSDHLPD